MKVSLNPQLFASHYRKVMHTPGADVKPQVFLVYEEFKRELYFQASGIVYCTYIPLDENWNIYLENFVNNLIQARNVED